METKSNVMKGLKIEKIEYLLKKMIDVKSKQEDLLLKARVELCDGDDVKGGLIIALMVKEAEMLEDFVTELKDALLLRSRG